MKHNFIILRWNTEANIIRNLAFHTPECCFNIIDVVYKNPFQRLKKRKLLFYVLEKYKIEFNLENLKNFYTKKYKQIIINPILKSWNK